MRGLLSIIFVSSMIAVLPLSAQDDDSLSSVNFTRELGDQSLSLDLGVMVPLFSQAEPGGSFHDMGLTVGGWFSITWDIYFMDMLKGGVDLGGAFALSESIGTPTYLFNFLIRLSYVPKIDRFDFPITLAFGLNGIRFEENSKGDFILKPGIGFYWNINSIWSVGVNINYVFIPQSYGGPIPPESDTRLVNFLDTSISVRYHF